jgi:2-oxoglutarate ferredoxin oxidoreductase subunit alpha
MSSAASAINDFTINVATVNGSGSASSNTILAKTIFRMGVHVAPKNLFPSNIAGMPTWFLVRVSEKQYLARSGTTEVLVAMNAATASKDIAELDAGAVLFIDEALPQATTHGRDDIRVFVVPFAKIAKGFAPDPRLRKLLANMVYVGVLTEMLSLDLEAVNQVIADQFGGKEKVVNLNRQVVAAGINFAKEHFDSDQCPYSVESRDQTQDKILIEGNQAAALGCLMGGCTFVGWYPITPSSSVCEGLIDLFHKYRVDKDTGEHRFAAVQAEDELASIGQVLGAGWAGARAMTATSGPGISLMGEFAGFGYFAEIPGVVFDIQRAGPSTGLPTRTQQGDIAMCRHLSHGDTEHILLIPAGPEEIYDFSRRAFDYAERFQTLIFVLSDLDQGMNLLISDRLEYPTEAFDRGKVLDKEGLEKAGEFARYKDVDGDGVPYRTLPGTRHPLAPYFTRGSGHDENANYTEDGEVHTAMVDRLKRKIDGAIAFTPKPNIFGDLDADVGVIHYGSTRSAVTEARHRLAAEGIRMRSMRVRSVPLHDEVIEFVRSCKVIYMIEQNRDGQMADLLIVKAPELAAKVKKVLYYGGMPMSAQPIVDAVMSSVKEFVHV